MSTQIKWLDEWFGVKSSHVRSVNSFSTACAAKLTVDDEEESCKVAGFELETFSFSFTTALATGGNPREELEALTDKVGKNGTLYINGKRWGPLYFKLVKVTLGNYIMDNLGVIHKAEINLEFLEHYSEKSATTAKIYYDGVDISKKITVKSCFYDSYAESQADVLKIVFNDTERLWDGWKPENSKLIRLKQNKLDTGRMYVHDVAPENGVMTLTAYSTPPTVKKETSKSWEKVRLLQLAEEIAKRHGLEFEAHGVTDQIYTYVKQGTVSDFEFLEERAKLEGCAFLVYDKKLVLYSEHDREHAQAVKTITLKENSNYSYHNNAAKKVKACTVLNSDFKGYFEDKDADTPKEITRRLNLKISGQAEADRFAKNLLRMKNKIGQTGEFKSSLIDDVAAGSVLNIDTVGVKSWKGTAFINHVRHDLVKNTSKIWIRRPYDD